jgi:putative FmdB family regulatory protein
MPIYEYRCSVCGFQKEYLQRLSDPRHTVCPKCGKRTLEKMVTAAGFHLKGTGWYATDFKNSGAKPKEKGKGKEKAADGPAKEASASEAPAKEAPAKEAPAKEAPAKEAPAKDSSKPETKSSASATSARN